jgi:uncharacterized protein
MHLLMSLFLLASTLQIRLNDERVSVELARTEKERARGLMERNELAEGSGMLFIYRAPHILSFWMKNTKIPLSVGFFDERRRLINIEDMDPPAGSALCVYRSIKPAQYALEVPQGWFEQHRIKLGMRFEWESPDQIPFP